MNAELVFGIMNMLVLPAWMLLLIAPQWGVTHRLVHSGLYSAGYAVAYLVLLLPVLLHQQLNFSSLAAVAGLFSNQWVLLAGWAHYLAFDLFIGAWMVRDAHDLGYTRLVMAPLLVLTFYVGPIGYGAYLVMRLVKRRFLR